MRRARYLLLRARAAGEFLRRVMVLVLRTRTEPEPQSCGFALYVHGIVFAGHKSRQLNGWALVPTPGNDGSQERPRCASV
jgi:hypothetical protein